MTNPTTHPMSDAERIPLRLKADNATYTPEEIAEAAERMGRLEEVDPQIIYAMLKQCGRLSTPPVAAGSGTDALEDAIFQVIYDEDFQSGFLSREWATSIAKKIRARAQATPQSAPGDDRGVPMIAAEFLDKWSADIAAAHARKGAAHETLAALIVLLRAQQPQSALGDDRVAVIRAVTNYCGHTDLAIDGDVGCPVCARIVNEVCEGLRTHQPQRGTAQVWRDDALENAAKIIECYPVGINPNVPDMAADIRALLSKPPATQEG